MSPTRSAPALGDAGATKAAAAIADRMQGAVLASDVVSTTIVRGGVDGVLRRRQDKNHRLPNPRKTSPPTTISAGWKKHVSRRAWRAPQLGHGGKSTRRYQLARLTWSAFSVNGTDWYEGGKIIDNHRRSSEKSNFRSRSQGDFDREGGGHSASASHHQQHQPSTKRTSSTISAGEISTRSRHPARHRPRHTVALEIRVDTVPGEQVSEDRRGHLTGHLRIARGGLSAMRDRVPRPRGYVLGGGAAPRGPADLPFKPVPCRRSTPRSRRWRGGHRRAGSGPLQELDRGGGRPTLDALHWTPTRGSGSSASSTTTSIGEC